MGFVHVDEEVTKGNAGVPRAALVVAGVFAVAVIVLAGISRVSDSGTLGQHSTATPVASRALVFADQPDGSVSVFDVQRGQVLTALPAGGGGFVRGALRALARQRRLAHVGPDVPFHLVRWSDGRLTLDDSTTGNHLELDAYGTTNLASFEKLLDGTRP